MNIITFFLEIKEYILYTKNTGIGFPPHRTFSPEKTSRPKSCGWWKLGLSV